MTPRPWPAGVQCPFCHQTMQAGHLRARGYATVWSPDDAGGSRLPPPLDAVTRGRRQETVVVGNHDRTAHRCPACEAVLVAPLRPV